MAQTVNLDALIPRADFAVVSEGDESFAALSLQIRDLEPSFFYGAIRKPDFQRETADWTPEKVVELVRSFLDGDLIPAIILWKNRDLVFVIDGSHRLSALIAWVRDDYGDGELSQNFFDYRVPAEQQAAADKTRTMIANSVGSYADHVGASAKPEDFSPEIVRRARRLGSLALQLQWVRGDATKAEDSFLRINQKPAIISPQELNLIKRRREPNVIAARAIIRCGTGHKYWSGFASATQREIEQVAGQCYDLLFQPDLTYPIKSAEVPLGGKHYSSTALSMVFDFINICVQTPSERADPDGILTLEYLRRTKRVLELLCSNRPGSLGLHPAVYTYSWTGKQQPILLLVFTEKVIEWSQNRRLHHFIEHRREFEDFLLHQTTLVNQVVRKFGTKSSGKRHLADFYADVLDALGTGVSPDAIPEHLMKNPKYSFLQPEEVPYGGKVSTKFSSSQKSGIVMRTMLASSHRCPICGGHVPAAALSIDHVVPRREGGEATTDNAQITHPYCNTGVKR